MSDKNKFNYISLILAIVIIILFIYVIIVNSNNIYFIMPIMSIFSLVAIYFFIKEIKVRNKQINIIKNVLKSTFKENLNSITTPVTFLNADGNILWKNKLCDLNITDEEILEAYAVYINSKEDYDLKKLSYKFKNALNKSYLASYEIVIVKDIKNIVITFIDITNEEEIKNNLEKNNSNVVIVVIDNYEDTFQGLEEIDKAEIVTKLDSKLRSFASENNGIAQKIEKDKYLIILKQQYIDKMIENNFNILDEIKQISDKTKLPITISMGISAVEDEISDKYKSALQALEIAKGRGGNQVVIKKNKKFDFYGELNEEQDKTSRVKSRSIASALVELINKSNNIYIVGHKNPDADCIGSSIGVSKICSTHNKDTKILMDLKLSNTSKLMIDKLKENGISEDIFLTKEDFKKLKITEDDLLIVVDTHKPTYLLSGDITNKFKNIVVIDHHRRGPEFIENVTLLYHELYASSASELVTEIIMHLDDIKLNSIEAEVLYAGILIDTKNFSYKTGVRTFEVAAYLKSIGIDISEVKEMFQNDFDTYLAKAEIVKNAQLIDEKIAIAICDKEYEDSSTLIAQTADELLTINSILASFVLCTVGNTVIISSRSNGDINVQSIMQKLGGGGHLTFAGAQIQDMDILEVKEKLINIINEEI